MPVERDLVIGVDCSTTASKALIFDRTGRLAAQGRGEMTMDRPAARSHWHEQSAEAWWLATAAALRSAAAQVDPARLAAVCLAVQRETFVPLDEGGQPVRPAILWMDERSRDLLPQLETALGGDWFHQATGKPLSGNLSTGKILWLQQNEPEIFHRTALYADVHAYLAGRLTGRICTSWGCADPMGLFDMRSQTWSAEIAAALGIRLEQLPVLLPPGALLGEVSEQASGQCGLPVGLPLVAGIGDGQACGLGVGLADAGQSYLSLGTSVISGTLSHCFRTDRAFRTMTAGIPGTTLLETVLLGGSYTLSWFMENFSGLAAGLLPAQADYAAMEAAAGKIAPGAEGLMLVPYWNTAMNPYWDAAASGMVIGWRGIHTPAHLYRAILEGIAFEQRLHTSGVEAACGQVVECFIASGGGARSDLWRQIVADITGKAVYRTAVGEAAALGAAMLAAAAVGFFADARQAAAAMTRLQPGCFEPDAQRHVFYSRLYNEVYRHLFPALQPYQQSLAYITSQAGN